MKKEYKSLLVLALSVILGSIVGLIFKEKIIFLKPLGDIFLNLMFTLVVPLVLVTVIDATSSLPNLKKLTKTLFTIFLVFLFTSLIAGIFMLIILKFINPVSGLINLEEQVSNALPFAQQLVKAVTVSDFYMLFSKSNILPLIIISIIFGISLSLVGEKSNPIKDTISLLSKVLMKMIKIIMLYAPIGLFAYFACLVGEYGPSIIGSYFKCVLIYYVAAILYFVIFYTIYCYIASGRAGVSKFYKNIITSFITSLATQSSLATLPVNMEVADKMSLDKNTSKITLSLGSTMHMEGSSMGAILKIMFVFSLLGMPFKGVDVLVALVIAVISAVVMAGVPGGGLIGEALIVSAYGLPMSSFAVIATIGILIDPPATMLNAVGDITSSMLVEKFK